MKEQAPTIELCILAGGASSRMGRNKAQLRLGRKTMLGIIRAEAEKTARPVRVIRRDKVERCGPLGGVFTALATTSADAVLFLACDMPLMKAAFLRRILACASGKPIFVQSESPGFPFLLGRDLLPVVVEQMEAREFSVQRLCAKVKGKILKPTRAEAELLFNVNTPEDLLLLKAKL